MQRETKVKGQDAGEMGACEGNAGSRLAAEVEGHGQGPRRAGARVRNQKLRGSLARLSQVVPNVRSGSRSGSRREPGV